MDFSRSSCSGVALGKRTLGTAMSRISTVRSSLSVWTLVENHAVPKTGSACPVTVTETAALALSMLPSNTSGCGW